MSRANTGSKCLLVIGAGLEQIRVYTLAKEMGYRVVGSDRNPDAPAFKYGDDSLICSTRSVSETMVEVVKYSKERRIDGVMTLGNDAAVTVANVAQYLGLPGISIESAEMASDKQIMKACFKTHNVPSPDYQIITTKLSFFKAVKNKNFPLILKPSDGRGSRGVLLLEAETDLNWAWEHACGTSENKVMLLEPFISGDQLSVEGMFVNGEFVAAAFADRNYQRLKETKPFIIEDGGVIPSVYEGEILDNITRCIEKATLSLGISEGPVKADIVLANNKTPMIIELAARLSGNYLASHHLRWSHGIDIVSEVIKYALGENVSKSNLSPKFRKYLAARYFFPKQGYIKNITGVVEVESLSYVKKLDIYRNTGDLQPIISANVDRAGIVRCMGGSLAEATNRVEHVVEMIRFEIE